MQSIHPVPAESITVLVADSDPTVVAVASAALERAGYVPCVATDAEQALAIAREVGRPRIVIADWTMHTQDGERLGCALRKMHRYGELYIIALASTKRQKEAVHAIDAGADEYVTKPLATDELVARVGWAHRLLASVPLPSRQLRAILQDASKTKGGEVVISCEGDVGRIFFHEGRIVWATLSSRPTTLMSLFEGAATLTQDEVTQVLEESKRSQRNFVELLVAWGLVDEADATTALRRWVQDTIRAMLALEAPRVMFVPVARASWGGPRFTLADVLPAQALPSMPFLGSRPPPSSGKIRCQFWSQCTSCSDAAANLAEDVRESGAAGIAIVHAPSGVVLGAAGEPIDEDILRAQLTMFGALAEEESVEDVVVSGGTKHYLVRSTACPDAFVCMTGSKQTMNLGSVRHESSRIAGRILPAESATSQRRLKALATGSTGFTVPPRKP